MRELSIKEINHVAGAGLGGNASASVTASADLSSGPSNSAYQLLSGGILAYTQYSTLAGFITSKVAESIAFAANPVAGLTLFSLGYVATPWILKGLDQLAPSK